MSIMEQMGHIKFLSDDILDQQTDADLNAQDELDAALELEFFTDYMTLPVNQQLMFENVSTVEEANEYLKYELEHWKADKRAA